MHQQTVQYITWLCYLRIWSELVELEQICRVASGYNIDAETVSYREVQVGNGNVVGYRRGYPHGGHCCEMDLGW